MTPRNDAPRLVLHGGWEFTKDDGVDKIISEFAGGKILLIPDASKFPEKQTERAVERYRLYKTRVLLLDKKAAVLPQGIRVLYVGGGQPTKLMTYFKNRPELLENIKAKWRRREITWCGCSAGAITIMPRMLAPNSYGRGEADLELALGLINNNAIVVPHWNADDTEEIWRQKVLKTHRGKLVITIDEHTALFWHQDKAEIIGLGTVGLACRGQHKIYKNGQMISGLKIQDHI
ncbi:MAG: Type 1 glutamine amidotransferase-like domain-containing protein [Candidatus Vogelbacteria bacterium]|nr:Type 1 glutamine amidotransferase-like domain-containing protein [Candidatus Vogelbacteria bacterium]